MKFVYKKQEYNKAVKDFYNSSDKQKWIDEMKRRNVAPINVEVNTDDKFLTLSTCQNNGDGRVVVHAKLIKRQKRVD